MRKKLLDAGVGNDFVDMTPKAQATKNKNKNKQEWLYQTESLLQSKRNDQQKEKATYGTGEKNIFKLYV